MSRRSLCVRVQKMHGEGTLILASRLKLVGKELEIKRIEGFICIPLVRRPSELEFRELENQAAEAKVLTCVFREKPKRTTTLAELLDGKLASNLLASLPRSADIVGNIAIVEIPAELEAYKPVVGEAILRLNKNVRTVLAKAGAVSGTYRLRGFSIIAGEENTVTVHKEYGCQYYVDLSKAYFSPRLSHEHNRVASLVREGETVIDMFAGVGPFAIQIARRVKGVRVYAVDANPYAIEFLKKNARLNRVENKVVPILGDAKVVVSERLHGAGDRVIMNLPETAKDFICVACDALKPAGGKVHFYGFVTASESLEKMQYGFADAVDRCGRKVAGILRSRLVRATAPYEWQFVLDADVA
jgi:tRNA (guanine37-N1)-methyltransferase